MGGKCDRPRKYARSVSPKLKEAAANDRRGLGLGKYAPAGFVASPERIEELRQRVASIAKVEIENDATAERYKQILIMAVADGISWQTACQILGLTAVRFQEWRTQDTNFADRLRDAASCAVARLKDKAYELAVGGSERMLEFLLAAYAGEEFRAPAKGVGSSSGDTTVAMLQAVGRILDSRTQPAPQIDHQPS